MAEVPVKMGRVGGSSIVIKSNAAGRALHPAIESRNGKVVTTSRENRKEGSQREGDRWEGEGRSEGWGEGGREKEV